MAKKNVFEESEVKNVEQESIMVDSSIEIEQLNNEIDKQKHEINKLNIALTSKDSAIFELEKQLDLQKSKKEIEPKTNKQTPKFKEGDIVYLPTKYQRMKWLVKNVTGYSVEGMPLYRVVSRQDDFEETFFPEILLVSHK